jgi:hypothetical protein
MSDFGCSYVIDQNNVYFKEVYYTTVDDGYCQDCAFNGRENSCSKEGVGFLSFIESNGFTCSNNRRKDKRFVNWKKVDKIVREVVDTRSDDEKVVAQILLG